MIIHDYSPLRYPNNKRWLASFFDFEMRKMGIYGGTFAEVFGGGCDVGINLLAEGTATKLRINDYDRGIVAFWNCVCLHPNWMTQKIRETDVTLAEWYKQREILQTSDDKSPEYGFATLFLNRTSIGGYLNGTPVGGFYGDTTRTIEESFDKKKVGLNIRFVKRYAKYIRVTDFDAKYYNQFCTRRTPKDSLIYFDPPCHKTDTVSLFPWTLYDHEAFLDSIQYVPHSRLWILTFDCNDELKQIYGSKYEIAKITKPGGPSAYITCSDYINMMPTQEELDNNGINLIIEN